MARRLLKELLRRSGYALFNTRRHYAQDGLFTLHRDHFRADPAFQAAYARGVKASGGLDPQFEWRVHVALWAALRALRIPGDFAECGVNAGFMSSAIMQRVDWRNVEKRFYLIDTFAGPVLTQYSQEEASLGRVGMAKDSLAAGAYVTDMARVRANYTEWPNAIVVQGAVPDILPSLEIGKVAFLHLDLNCAYPERAALEFFWHLLSPGALVLLDDYTYFGHQCQAEAIDAVARQLGTDVLSLPTGQGLIIK